MIPSVSLFNNTASRKQSLSKTFSHPSLTQRLSGDDGTSASSEPVNLLALRKPSITRVSSCPPAIQANSGIPQELSERHTELVEKQEEVRYVQSPTLVGETDQTRNEDGQLPCAPLVTQLELPVLGTSIEDTVGASPDDLGDAEGDSEDDNNDDAEALAMMSLAGLVKASVALPSDPTASDYHCYEDRSNEESDTQSPESGSTAYSQPANTVSLVGLFSAFSTPTSFPPADEYHRNEERNDEECDEKLSECGSSSYVTLDKTASTSSDVKLKAGSYVTISTTTSHHTPQDQAQNTDILETHSTLHSTVHDFIPLSASSQSSISNTGASRSTYSKPSVQNREKLISVSDFDVSSHHIETAPHESLSQLKNTSLLEGVGLTCKSPDELLASFSNLNQQSGMTAEDLAEFHSDVEGSSPMEGSSPLITDFQDDSEGNDTDSSSRDDAELSLGRMFHSGFNRILKDDNDERGNALDPAIHILTNLPGFEFDVMLEKPVDAQEDDKYSHDNAQSPTQTNVDNNTLFTGSFCSEAVDDHEVEPEGLLFVESPDVFHTPCFDDEFFSNIPPVHSAPIVPVLDHSQPELGNTTDAMKEQENNADDEISDNALGMSCGSVVYSPAGKVHFLNSPTLMFDQGQENFEMKEFPLNNLSKECLKSTELLFFKDNQSENQGTSSNQLDEVFSDEGFTVNGELDADDVIEGNVLETSASNPYQVDVEGRFKGKTKPDMLISNYIITNYYPYRVIS